MKYSFSKTLSHALGKCNLSKVSKDLDIPKSLLHDWLHAKRSPNMSSMHHVRKLAQHVGIDFEELLFGDGIEDLNPNKVLTTVTFNDSGNYYSITITKLENS